MAEAPNQSRLPVTDESTPSSETPVESEHRFQKLVEALPDAILVHSDGTITFVNPFCIRLLGAQRSEQILGKNISEFVHPDFMPEIKRRIEQHRLTGQTSPPLECVIVTLNGASVDVEGVAIPILWNGLPSTEVVIRDISERKRLQQAAHEWQMRLNLAENAGLRIGLWEWDYAANKVVWSNEVCRQLGYTRDTSKGTLDDFMRLPHPEDRSAIQAAIQKVIDGSQEYAAQYRVLEPDGSICWIDSRGVVIDRNKSRMIGITIDITDLKNKEEMLQENREQYLLLLNSTAEGIYGLDLNGICTFCNPSAATMLGYKDSSELVGRSAHRLHHHSRPDGTPLAESECKIHQAFLTGSGNHADDEIFLRLDGTSFPIEYWSHPIVRRGHVIGSAVTFLDITERRNLEQQFLQAQKMEAVGLLAGGIAHDFNNLLGVITGYSELLQITLSPDSPQYKQAGDILRAGNRAASLTRQLLAFSRKQPLRPVVFDLNSLITETDKMLRRLIGENIELVLNLNGNAGKIKADPGQIEQVLMNLAVNARDAMPRCGTLTIETANAEIDSTSLQSHPYIKTGSYVVLKVSDTGCGMNKETQTRIFEPFFTTKESGKGTGLGLSTVYGIVKQSDGYIRVDSTPGKGTEFSVYLPRVQSPNEPIQAAETIKTLRTGSETILLVEDEPMLRQLTRSGLETGGYNILEAPDAKTAIQVALLYQGPIHLLLTDVILPGMSGRELAETLLQSRPDLRLLYMSGYTDDHITQHGVLTPETMLLEKPFSIESLFTKVRKALESETIKPESPV